MPGWVWVRARTCPVAGEARTPRAGPRKWRASQAWALEAAGIYEISVSGHSHGLVSKQRTPKSNKWCSVFPLFICLSVWLCLSLSVSVCLCLSVCHTYLSIHQIQPYLLIYPSICPVWTPELKPSLRRMAKSTVARANFCQASAKRRMAGHSRLKQRRPVRLPQR